MHFTTKEYIGLHAMDTKWTHLVARSSRAVNTSLRYDVIFVLFFDITTQLKFQEKEFN